MPMTTTGFDLDRDGFAVFPGMLPHGAVAALRGMAAQVVAQPRAPGPWLAGLDDDSPFNVNYLQRAHLWRRTPDALPTYRSARLLDAVQFAGRSSAYRLFFDALMAKRAFGGVSRWHVDGVRWPFDATEAVTLWVALEDVTAANGCLAYLPGSHRLLRDIPNRGYPPGIGGLQAAVPELHGLPVVTCPTPAGSIVVHDACVAHAVLPNMTSTDRWALTLNLVPDGARPNGEVSPLLPPDAMPLGLSDLCDDTLCPRL